MAHLTRYPFFRHLRAEPNQYILHFRNGRVRRKGVGLAYWFRPLAAAVAQVPIEDIETTFLLKELSADFQEVTVQCVLRYRCIEPERAATRLNFGISLERGAWLEAPLERLASFWSERARQPARAYLRRVELVEAVRAGGEAIQQAVETALREDTAVEELGLNLVAVQVVQVVPSADMEKALQTPTREAIQQRADEATFARRAMAVEKERAIKENELATEIELARRQEQLIRQQGANQLEAIRQDAEAEGAKVEAELQRNRLVAEGDAHGQRVRAEAEADSVRLVGEAQATAEAHRLTAWKDMPSAIVFGLGLKEIATKLQTINHLNVTPDFLGDVLRRLVEERAER